MSILVLSFHIMSISPTGQRCDPTSRVHPKIYILVTLFVIHLSYYWPYIIIHNFGHIMSNAVIFYRKTQDANPGCHVFPPNNSFHGWEAYRKIQLIPWKFILCTLVWFDSIFIDILYRYLRLLLYHSGLVIFPLHSKHHGNNTVIFMYGECTLILFQIMSSFNILPTPKYFTS